MICFGLAASKPCPSATQEEVAGGFFWDPPAPATAYNADMSITDNFRTNLRGLLEEEGWTMKDLADQLHCTPSYISQLITGHRNPGLETAQRVADALNVKLERLLENRA